MTSAPIRISAVCPLGQGTRNSATGAEMIARLRSIDPRVSQGSCAPFCRAPNAACATADTRASTVA